MRLDIDVVEILREYARTWALLDKDGNFVDKKKVVQDALRDYARLKKEAAELRSVGNTAPRACDPEPAAPQRVQVQQPPPPDPRLIKKVVCEYQQGLIIIENSQAYCDQCAQEERHPSCPRVQRERR